MADLPPVEEVAEATDPVRESLAAHARRTCEAEQVQVRWTGLRASVPDTATLTWHGNPCRPAPVLTLVATEDGALLGRWTLRPSLSLVVSTWVAPRDLQPGERFEPVRGPAALRRPGAVRFTPGPSIATRPVRAGTPLHPGLARPAPDVPSGAQVRVVVARGPVRVAAPGTLVEAGFLGRAVRVRNAVTGAVQRGTLSDPDTVLLP
jgi:hypothetical protein